jgi:hypothetical protein
MLEIEGVDSVADVILAGTEEQVAADLHRYEAAGATELVAALIGSPAEQSRTTAFLTSLAQAA